jgi:hypothetical protein
MSKQQLDFCVKNNLNVMLIGRHGVGKTAMVKEAFESHGLRWKYFSASTMDPWVDFIGVPRETRDENDEIPYLELVRPKMFRDDTVEAIFIDEYNRAPKKVRNAVMELIQFGSINGHEFKNLRMVWIAINPNDGEYDTDGMDPAQEDRFHFHVEVPFKPSKTYLANKYGAHQSNAACLWWDSLPKEVQKKVSPRRLDYALQVFNAGGDLRGFVLPNKSGVTKLVNALKQEPIEFEFERLIEGGDAQGIRTFLADHNNYSSCEKLLLKNRAAMSLCFPELNIERQAALLNKSAVAKQVVAADAERYKKLLESIVKAGANDSVSEFAGEALSSAKDTVKANSNSINLVDHLQHIHSKKVQPSDERMMRANCHPRSTYVTKRAFRDTKNAIIPSDWRDASYLEKRVGGSTPARKSLINSVVRTISRNTINDELATRSLSIMNAVAERTYNSTLYSISGFNNCLAKLLHHVMATRGASMSEMIKTYPYLMVGPVYRLSRSDKKFFLQYGN